MSTASMSFDRCCQPDSSQRALSSKLAVQGVSPDPSVNGPQALPLSVRCKEQLDVHVHGVEALLEAQHAKFLATLEAQPSMLLEPLEARLLKHEQILTEKIEEIGKAHCAAVENAFPHHPEPSVFAHFDHPEPSVFDHHTVQDKCEAPKESRFDSRESKSLNTRVRVGGTQQTTVAQGGNGLFSTSISALGFSRSRRSFRDIFFSPQFEFAMCCVILVNVIVMLAHVELEGKQQAYALGFISVEPNHDSGFDAIEKVFNAIYVCELLPRIFFTGRKFFRSAPNVFDAVIVFIAVVESFLIQPVHGKGWVKISVLRLFRFTRIFRAAKFLRSSEHFIEIRVMLRTIRTGLRGVAWSMVLLSMIITTGGILMAQISQHFLDDDSVNLVTKRWLYDSFGTTSRAVWTMFESAFSGGWRIFARPLVMDVSAFFAVFWLLWVVFVNFTTMRIVASIFLKQTLKVAQVDEEKLAMENMKKKELFAHQLHDIFQKFDSSGDGAISRPEFIEMLKDPDIVKSFKHLGLDIDEVVALFGVLSSDDGDADYEEFLQGALKMNSSARTIDTVQVMHNQLLINRSIDRILELLESRA